MKAEAAIRRYMNALRDPETLLDTDAISSLQEQLEETTDPIERLKVRQLLITSSRADVDDAADAFAAVAKEWADKEGISASSFLAEGVPAGVLANAGFDVLRRPAKTGKKQGRRRKRVSAQQIRKSVPKGPFTARELIDLTGATSATVRKVIGELLEDGTITEAGPSEDHSGPGRAPMRYKVA